MKKIDKFKDELELIKTERIRMFAEKAIKDIPEYFFTIPASSSGKHHPLYALGVGGLLRHTKAAVNIANELFRQDSWSFSEIEKDLILVSLLLHDSRKSGEDRDKDSKIKVFDEESQNFYLSNTKAEHPLLAAKAILKDKENCELLTGKELNIMIGAIVSHMGQWNKNYKTGEEILPRPKTKIQKFVHLCDYIASRKFLEVSFAILEKVAEERREKESNQNLSSTQTQQPTKLYKDLSK